MVKYFFTSIHIIIDRYSVPIYSVTPFHFICTIIAFYNQFKCKKLPINKLCRVD